MSAYVVEKKHIDYIVQAISTWGIHTSHENTVLRIEKHMRAEERQSIGRELWEENVKSCLSRYHDTPREELPRAMGDEPFEYTPCRTVWSTIDPVQVIKACHCYEYQSCEHEGWDKSRAAAIVDGLIHAATRHLRGYTDAEWGPPVDSPTAISLLSMARKEL